MKRAIRRHYVAKIKKLISREIEEINTRYDQPRRWGKPNPARDETRKQQAVRYAYRDEGRYVRQKVASGRGFFCGCEWCIGNWTYSSTREIARINDEEKDFMSMGCPPDWGYDWRDLWDYDFYEDTDYSWDDWYEYLETEGINPVELRRQSFGYQRRKAPTLTYWVAEVV